MDRGPGGSLEGRFDPVGKGWGGVGLGWDGMVDERGDVCVVGWEI